MSAARRKQHRFFLKFLAAAVATAAGLAAPVLAQAQQYPSGRVSIVVPFAAGGATDITARLLAEKLTESLKQSVIVENKAGANSQIGTAAVVNAKPDGLTLLLGTSSLINNPNFYKMSYDVSRDLRPVVGVVDVPVFLVVGPKTAAKDAREFIAAAKAANGAMNYSSAGAGSTLHLAAEWLKSNAGFNANHIPHKGSGPSVAALAQGEVDFSMENYGPALPHMQSKRVRVLAIGGPNRFPSLPEIPTFKEAGLPDSDLSSWFVLMAPAATPDGVVATLNEKVNAILQMPDVRQRLQNLGLAPMGGTSEGMRARMKEDAAKWSTVIKAAKVTVD
jgi:tripartite-type tricarboxylate transporter receptor subunit TctC